MDRSEWDAKYQAAFGARLTVARQRAVDRERAAWAEKVRGAFTEAERVDLRKGMLRWEERQADKRINRVYAGDGGTRGLEDLDVERARVEAGLEVVAELGSRPLSALPPGSAPQRNPVLAITVERTRSRMRDARRQAFDLVIEDPATPKERVALAKALRMQFVIAGAPVDDDEAFARTADTYDKTALVEGAEYNAEHAEVANG